MLSFFIQSANLENNTHKIDKVRNKIIILRQIKLFKIKNNTMAGSRTLTIIKPFAVKKKYIGLILSMIEENGFTIKALKFTQLSHKQATRFYEIHKDKSFFMDLVHFMSSGPIVAAIIEKENAVEEYRKLIGSTNPIQAEDNTIRKLFGISVQKNAVHGSDSDENAKIECDFFFSLLDLY